MALIPEYAKKNFEIHEGDCEHTILLKKYYLDLDRISIAETKKDFDTKYNQIKSMRSKTPIEQLKLQVAIDEFLSEY